MKDAGITIGKQRSPVAIQTVIGKIVKLWQETNHYATNSTGAGDLINEPTGPYGFQSNLLRKCFYYDLLHPFLSERLLSNPIMLDQPADGDDDDDYDNSIDSNNDLYYSTTTDASLNKTSTNTKADYSMATIDLDQTPKKKNNSDEKKRPAVISNSNDSKPSRKKAALSSETAMLDYYEGRKLKQTELELEKHQAEMKLKNIQIEMEMSET